jgi:hypothetical protein
MTRKSGDNGFLTFLVVVAFIGLVITRLVVYAGHGGFKGDTGLWPVQTTTTPGGN